MRNKVINFTENLSVGEKTLYFLLYGFVWLMSLIPFPIIYFLSDLLYILVYKIVGYRKKIVRKNLKESFPEKSDEELQTIEKHFYHWFCDYINETIKLASMSKKEMQKRMVYKNPEVFTKLFEDGHNIAVYLGHYCNWEWVTSIGLYVPDNAVGGQVYHVLENKVFDRLLLKLRSKMGTESISMENILRRIVESKREGLQMAIGFISDQVPFWNNIHYWTDFLHHDTPVLTGTERLAKKYDFACVYLDMNRTKRGYYEAELKVLTDEPKKYENWQITEMYFREFEKTIQRSPELWLWTHNRWKRTREEYNKMIDPATGRIKC